MRNPKIIYEDNHLLLAFKPEGVPSQSDKSGEMDFLTQCKLYLKEKYEKTGQVYLALLHRLDRPVSGLMLFAKTSKAASRLSEQIRSHQWKKTYLAVCHGKLLQDKGYMQDYLYKNERENKSYVAKTEQEIQRYQAKKSSLRYEVLKYLPEKDLSLVLIHLETGRHHQIRVQFSSRGHALLNDQKYSPAPQVGQPCLCAAGLSFYHPVSKEKQTFFSFTLEKPGFHFFDVSDLKGLEKSYTLS